MQSPPFFFYITPISAFSGWTLKQPPPAFAIKGFAMKDDEALKKPFEPPHRPAFSSPLSLFTFGIRKSISAESWYSSSLSNVLSKAVTFPLPTPVAWNKF
jgi:hypothetical protein